MARSVYSIIWPLLYAILTAALVVQHAIVLKRNRELRSDIARLLSERVQLGDRFGELAGTDPDGLQVRMDIRRQPLGTVLIGMSRFCGACTDSLPVWNRISEVAQDLGLAVAWISRDRSSDMTAYRHANNLRGIVLADPTYGTYLQMKLGLVPQTVLIDSGGKAVAVWAGSIDDGHEAEIETAVRSLAASQRDSWNHD